MNNWYAVDRLGAAHRADLAHEAAQARLAVSARRGEATVGDRKTSRLPRAARGAVIRESVMRILKRAGHPTAEVYELPIKV